LLLATALIVPAGLMTAQSAGATPKNTATCKGNTGTLHLTPGVRATNAVGQTIDNGTTGRLTGCKGVGIAGTTAAAFSFKVNRAAVTCSSIRGKTFIGSGVIKWDSPGSNSNVVTNVKLKLTFNSYVKITFDGTVTSTYLHGTTLSGTASIPDTLKPVGVGGGKCQNKARVRNLAYKQTSDTKL
jgi:hypothetical protein